MTDKQIQSLDEARAALLGAEEQIKLAQQYLVAARCPLVVELYVSPSLHSLGGAIEQISRLNRETT